MVGVVAMAAADAAMHTAERAEAHRRQNSQGKQPLEDLQLHNNKQHGAKPAETAGTESTSSIAPTEQQNSPGDGAPSTVAELPKIVNDGDVERSAANELDANTADGDSIGAPPTQGPGAKDDETEN